MKKIILIFISLILSQNSFSQSPQGFNYQAVVRDIDGNVRSNQGVQFIFEIRNATGNAVYTEFHTAITNKYGLVDDIIIGNGSSSDNFSSIDWGSGIYFVNVKIDGVDMGTTQLLSVPYALYALNAGSGVATDGVGISSTVDNNNGTFTLNYTDGTSFTTINMTGPEGKSAYDSWLSSGEVGTEKEFLVSLIGSSGVKGDTGDTGDKGDKGDPGLDGLGLGDVTGGASSVITENLDTSRVLVSNLVGKISVSGISTNELNTLDNITSNVQIQIDQKQNLNQNLSDISTIDPINGAFIVGDGTKFIKKSPSEVRTSLNLGNIVFQDSTDISITGGSVTGITDITIADGGTGASTPEAARFNLNVDIKGTDNSTDVTLAQVPSNYLSISRQEITSGVIPIELGGTASTSSQGARANLRLGSIATQDSTDISILGGTITGITDLAIADGGTGASTAAEARINLGLGTVSTQDSSGIFITGGSITGITDITIVDGGTGASTANNARTNLGLAIGTDVQAWDQVLEDLSGQSPTTNNFLVGDGTNFTMKSPADSRAALNLGSIATQNINNVKITGGEITGITDISIADGGTGASSAADARTNLGVAIGSDVQAYDAELASVAGLTSAADKGIQFTGSGTASTFDLTAVGKALLDDADAAAQRTTLGVDIGTDVQAYDTELAAVAGLTSAADKGIQFTGSGAAATYDLTAAGKALLDDADATAQLVTLGVTSTAAELNIIDGTATTQATVTLQDADGFVISDGDVMKQALISDIATYVNANTSINDLTDGKANDTNFSNSILIGQSITGILNSAEYNVGLGYGVFDALTSGDRNMGIGYNALNRVTQGSGNIAMGGQSLTALTTGNRNVAIGRQSGRDVDDGQLSGGADLTTGEENTYIGAWTQPSASNVSNETVIGSEATGKGANTVVIGNPQVTQVYASEDAGATLYAAGLNLGGTAVNSSAAELNYVAGVSSAIQTQLDGKQSALTFGIGNTNVMKANANVADNDFLRVDGTFIEGRSAAEMLSDLGAQASDAELAAIAGLTSAADKGIQFTGSGTASTYDLTSAGKALLDDADAAAQLVTLGVTSTAAELNILDASASNSISSDGAVSNGNFTSNNYKISHTFTIDGNLADDADTNDITITNDKVLATSVIITSASINVNIDVHTVVTGSFKVRITNKSGAQLNDNSTIIINYIVL